MSIKNNQVEDAGKALSASPNPPETAAGQGAFWTKMVAGVAEAFYVDSDGNQIQLTDNGAPAGAGALPNSEAIDSSYVNLSGSTIAALIPVRSSSGTLATIDPSIEAQVNSILGITVSSIPNNTYGDVVLAGLLENVTTSIAVDSIVYLSKTGGITATVPEEGVGGFVEGDFIVRLGQITRNSSNPANKDFKVQINVVGQL